MRGSQRLTVRAGSSLRRSPASLYVGDFWAASAPGRRREYYLREVRSVWSPKRVKAGISSISAFFFVRVTSVRCQHVRDQTPVERTARTRSGRTAIPYPHRLSERARHSSRRLQLRVRCTPRLGRKLPGRLDAANTRCPARSSRRRFAHRSNALGSSAMRYDGRVGFSAWTRARRSALRLCRGELGLAAGCQP
jgi:hypothetical protein